MVDPVSITLGVGGTVVATLAGIGLYLLGRRPDHIVNMRAVSGYYRRKQQLEALQQDVDDDEGQP
jgi:hypothetical protein